MNKLIGLILLLVVILGGIVLLTKKSGEPVPVNEPNVDVTTTTIGEVKEFIVVGTDFKFSPAEMKVNAGDTVRITLKNPDVMPHDLKIDELNFATKIIAKGGADETIEFIADKKGTFEYYCSVGNHREKGMVGKLIVE